MTFNLWRKECPLLWRERKLRPRGRPLFSVTVSAGVTGVGALRGGRPSGRERRAAGPGPSSRGLGCGGEPAAGGGVAVAVATACQEGLRGEQAQNRVSCQGRIMAPDGAPESQRCENELSVPAGSQATESGLAVQKPIRRVQGLPSATPAPNCRHAGQAGHGPSEGQPGLSATLLPPSDAEQGPVAAAHARSARGPTPRGDGGSGNDITHGRGPPQLLQNVTPYLNVLSK